MCFNGKNCVFVDSEGEDEESLGVLLCFFVEKCDIREFEGIFFMSEDLEFLF